MTAFTLCSVSTTRTEVLGNMEKSGPRVSTFVLRKDACIPNAGLSTRHSLQAKRIMPRKGARSLRENCGLSLAEGIKECWLCSVWICSISSSYLATYVYDIVEWVS